MTTYPMGRRVPPDMDHVAKFPAQLRAAPSLTVERKLPLPTWHWSHDQGQEGSCVGHGAGMERAITNTSQNRLLRVLLPSRRYDTIDIWNQAKLVDGFPDTNPGDENGTTVRAAYDVLRDRGPSRVSAMKLVGGKPVPVGGKDPLRSDGAVVNRWATTTDEMRASISAGLPVTIGVNWYSDFDRPVQKGTTMEWWIGLKTGSLGAVRGGHSLCVYGASDKRQGFALKNSWGKAFPLVWVPYTTMQRLLVEDGEATVVVDR